MSWVPALIASLPAIVSTVGSLFENKGEGNKGKFSSTYNNNQLSHLDEMLANLKGGPPNVEDNPQYGQGMEWLNSLFSDPEFFNNFEAPLQRQFQEQTVPDLANRFASQGSGGSLGSTGFRNQLAREGSNLHTNIAALRGQMQQQGVNQAFQGAQQPFSNYMQQQQQALQPTQNQYQPPSPGFWGGMLPGTLSGAAQAWGNTDWSKVFPGSSGGGGGGSGFSAPGLTRGYSSNPGQAASTY